MDKSVGAAIALTCFFGPFGLFYTSMMAAFIMLGLTIIVGLFTLGFGLIVIWPASLIWAVVDASRMHQQFEMWKVSQLRP